MWYGCLKIAIRFVSRSNYSLFWKQTGNVPNFCLIKILSLATRKELYTNTEHAIRFLALQRITLILTCETLNSLQKLKDIHPVYLREVFQTTEQRQNRYACPNWTLFYLNLFEKQDYAIHHEQLRAHFWNGLFRSNSKEIACFSSSLSSSLDTSGLMTGKVVFTVQMATDKRLLYRRFIAEKFWTLMRTSAEPEKSQKSETAIPRNIDGLHISKSVRGSRYL